MVVCHQFIRPLFEQPDLFEMNSDQSLCLVASDEHCNYIDLKTRNEVFIDEELGAESIKGIVHFEEDKQFYIVCNQMNSELGFYLIKFDEQNPQNHKILTALVTRLELDNVSLFISQGSHKNGEIFKELVIGYKTMFINTYNTIIQDLTDGTILFKHEAFQLWESECCGVLCEVSKDYLHINNNGINVLSLGTIEKKRLVDHLGLDKMMHSFNSLDYLKLDSSNYINLKC